MYTIVIHVALQIQNYHPFWCYLHFLAYWSMLYVKNAQCDPICYNSSMSSHLCGNMNCSFSLIQHHCNIITLSSFSFLLDILCIKTAVMYTILSFFIDIIFKIVTKCLYVCGKFSSKVIITSSFVTGTSKQARWLVIALTLLMWSKKLLLFYILYVKNLRQTEINKLLVCGCCKRFFIPLLVLCNS